MMLAVAMTACPAEAAKKKVAPPKATPAATPAPATPAPAPATPTPAPPPPPPPVDAAKVFAPTDLDALREVMGQPIAVEGTLVAAGESKTQTVRYLNFTRNFREGVALVFFVKKGGDAFSLDALNVWVGKKVRVTGKLDEYKGALQIEVEKWDQVKESRVKRALFAVLATVILPLAASAWDAAGHMLVGQIAWEHAKPEVREKVSALVAKLESTYNEGKAYNFVTAPCWMDDMKSKKGYAWSAWHYVDIAFTPSGAPCSLPAEGPNIVWAINENIKTLRDAAATPEQKTEAVAMLMHFVGDIHQPLHCTDWNDRGGNDYLIHGIAFTDLIGKSPPNLHTLWDKAFRFDGRGNAIVEMWQGPPVAERPKKPGEGVIAEQAAKIMAAFRPGSLPELERVNTAANWAVESHTIGCLAGYPVGPHPGNHEVVELNSEFVKRIGPVGQLRVALAGYRLAAVLNEIFDPRDGAAGK